MKIISALVVYATMTVLTAGFLNANSRYGYYVNAYHGRENLAVSFGFSLLPPTWIIAPFMTGFYQDGWTLNGGATEY